MYQGMTVRNLLAQLREIPQDKLDTQLFVWWPGSYAKVTGVFVNDGRPSIEIDYVTDAAVAKATDFLKVEK